MDVGRFIPESSGLLNGDALSARGNAYTGVVSAVVEQVVTNRLKFTRDEAGKARPVRESVPVIVFADGVRVIPNIAMRRELRDRLGAETDLWVGHRLSIVQDEREAVSRRTGEVRVLRVKSVHVVDAVADLAREAPSSPAIPEPDESACPGCGRDSCERDTLDCLKANRRVVRDVADAIPIDRATVVTPPADVRHPRDDVPMMLASEIDWGFGPRRVQ